MFTTHTTHSHDYYLRTITALIAALKAGFTDQQTANYLNERGILSPTGKPFNRNTVSQILKKLRLHKEYPSKIHRALLQLCFDGRLNAADTLILFEPRKQGM